MILQLILGIFIPFLIAGFIDFFFKERKKRQLYAEGKTYNDMPAYLSHEKGWHLIIASIWIILQLTLVFLFGWPWQILLSAIIFYTEDIFYYLFTFIWYGGSDIDKEFLPKFVPWLHGNIEPYILLVGVDYPRSKFLIIYTLSWIIFLFILMVSLI